MISLISDKDFKKISLDDKDIFEKHSKKYPITHSDYLFTTMISWSSYIDYYYDFVDENLIIKTKYKNKIQFRPPIGKKNDELFKDFLKIAKENSTEIAVGMITKESKKYISSKLKNIKFGKNREYFDYVYLAKDLAELSGGDYSKIRNRLNKFTRNVDYSVEEINENNMEEVLRFLRRWCLWRDCDSDELLKNEKKAIMFSMKHFFDLDLKGIFIKVRDKIEAISVYEKMNDDTAVIHYEKGSPYYDGIYKAINMEAAKLLQKKFKFINRETDMGVPGLRKAKMSYKPHHMVEVHHIKNEDLKNFF